jgi:integrase
MLDISQKRQKEILARYWRRRMAQLRFLEQDEIERLLAVPNLHSDTGLRNRILMQLQAETGMRIGEAISIRPRDVVVSQKKVTIQRGKGGKTRVVYWRSDELSMLIERWKKRRPKSDYLFPTKRLLPSLRRPQYVG